MLENLTRLYDAAPAEFQSIVMATRCIHGLCVCVSVGAMYCANRTPDRVIVTVTNLPQRSTTLYSMAVRIRPRTGTTSPDVIWRT